MADIIFDNVRDYRMGSNYSRGKQVSFKSETVSLALFWTSGAGKTTVPTSGRHGGATSGKILFDGKDITDERLELTDYRRDR